MTASLTAFRCAVSSPVPRSTELRRLEARLTAGEVRLLNRPAPATVEVDAALLLALPLPPG
jgi:hypothetical protein